LRDIETKKSEELAPEAKQFLIYDKNENVTKNRKDMVVSIM